MTKFIKTSKLASIIGFTFGSIFLLFNLYMLTSTDPIFTDNDIPSLIIGFGTILISIYLFFMLKKILHVIFDDKKGTNFSLWIIRLEIVIGFMGLYLLSSSLFLYFRGLGNLIENPTNIMSSISSLIFNVIITLGVGLILCIIYSLLGNSLLKLRKKEKFFLFLGILFILHGIIDLLTTINIIDNDFISPMIKCLSFIMMGFLFKKYANYDLENFDKLAFRTEQIIKKIDKSPQEEKITLDNDSKDVEDVEKDKDDHSRFMPK